MSFIKQFRKEREAHISALREITRVATIETINYAINKSPVANPDLWVWFNPTTQTYVDYVAYKGYPEGMTAGRFRSNWFLSTIAPSQRETKEVKPKGALIQLLTEQVINSPYSSRYFLTNNLPYAERLDNGWSTQAPNGITAPAALHVNSKLKRIEKVANQKYGIS